MVKNSFLFINSKEKIQDIVLVDTNIVIGLENIEPTKI